MSKLVPKGPNWRERRNVGFERNGENVSKGVLTAIRSSLFRVNRPTKAKLASGLLERSSSVFWTKQPTRCMSRAVFGSLLEDRERALELVREPACPA